MFTHEPEWLIAYHILIMEEMSHRGYNPDKIWYNAEYRGSVLGYETEWADQDIVDDQYVYAKHKDGIIYPEHNEAYLRKCIELLKIKEAPVNFEEVEKLLR